MSRPDQILGVALSCLIMSTMIVEGRTDPSLASSLTSLITFPRKAPNILNSAVKMYSDMIEEIDDFLESQSITTNNKVIMTKVIDTHSKAMKRAGQFLSCQGVSFSKPWTTYTPDEALTLVSTGCEASYTKQCPDVATRYSGPTRKGKPHARLHVVDEKLEDEWTTEIQKWLQAVSKAYCTPMQNMDIIPLSFYHTLEMLTRKYPRLFGDGYYDSAVWSTLSESEGVALAHFYSATPVPESGAGSKGLVDTSAPIFTDLKTRFPGSFRGDKYVGMSPRNLLVVH